MTGGRGQRLLAGIGLAALLILVVAATAFSLMLRAGVSTRDEPSVMETVFAGAARRLAAPAWAKTRVSPPDATTPSALTDARLHWASHCASCHGNDGSGSTAIGRNLYPRPPDMRAQETQRLADGELYAIIKNGVRLTGMPAWGEPGDADSETWALVAFIRTLPRLTANELAEVRNNAPRTPHELEEDLEDDAFLKAAPTAAPEHKEHHP